MKVTNINGLEAIKKEVKRIKKKWGTKKKKRKKNEKKNKMPAQLQPRFGDA